jgi:predicted dehydrogenase
MSSNVRGVRIGCIGCGFIADIHLRQAARMPGVVIGAVADVRAPSAEAFHERFGTGYWSTDPQRLIEDPDLDALLICTYPDTHADLAIRSAAAGKHVLLEKPMALSLSECLDILNAFSQAGVKLALDLKFRFSPAVEAVKRAIRSPRIIAAQAACDRLPEESHYMDPAVGGGLLENLGPHLIDLVCFFAGGEPVQVYARGNRLPDRKKTSFDAVIGTLEFGDGCIASFVVSDHGEFSYPSKWFYEISDGKTHAVVYDHCRSVQIGGGATEKIDGSPTPPHETGSYELLADFIAAIRDNRAPRVDGRAGLRAAIIQEAILESIRRAQPVAPEFPPAARTGF